MPKELRGFGTMKIKNYARLLELAGSGGRIAHEKGVAHEWTSEEARAAGSKGGRSTNLQKRQARKNQG